MIALGLIARLPPWLWAALAALVVVVGAYLAGGRDERASARLDAAESALEARRARDAVDRDVARDPDIGERLHRWQLD